MTILVVGLLAAGTRIFTTSPSAVQTIILVVPIVGLDVLFFFLFIILCRRIQFDMSHAWGEAYRAQIALSDMNEQREKLRVRAQSSELS